MKINYKTTLNLPKTKFQMKANLVYSELIRLKKWKNINLYYKIQKKNLKGKSFILHDGPPFTNGDIHLGTGLNKILKDCLIKYKSMNGFYSPYIPGWDCHGLPIEYKVSKNFKIDQSPYNILKIKKKCKNFSLRYLTKQRKQFIRLGIIADWAKEYKTIDSEYESDVIKNFSSFLKKEIIYRHKKPIYWSIPCKTALSESEIEYKEHVSFSTWVKFKIKKHLFFKISLSIFIIIWTTTPWTLPSNLAICLNDCYTYILLQRRGVCYLIGELAFPKFIKICFKKKNKNFQIRKIIKNTELRNLQAWHPFISTLSIPIIFGKHVIMKVGTGCVHTAPGHGLEDYKIGLKYKLESYSPINNNGEYSNCNKLPKYLHNVRLFDPSIKMGLGNIIIIKILKKTKSLLYKNIYVHKYPYCWRSKTPVISRSMDQWFINLQNLKNKVLSVINKIQWYPPKMINRIESAIKDRPDWCISRQRNWGIPVPILLNRSKTPLMNHELINKIAIKIKTFGSNIWIKWSINQLLENFNIPHDNLIKTLDTLDVWIDSGSSHGILKNKKYQLSFPANLYLEGNDQHRGWFQSSIFISILINNISSYKNVVTHNFIVDENNNKISKSDNNKKTISMFLSEYGADILRLWVCSENYQEDITYSNQILKNISYSYRNIRNTIRFQLGNLYNYKNPINFSHYNKMTNIDKWILEELSNIINKVSISFIKYNIHKVSQYINQFCTITLSSIYHDILKDRLYIYPSNSIIRRSSQTCIFLINFYLLRMISPIMAFTSEEGYDYLKNYLINDKTSIHLENWPKQYIIYKKENISNKVKILLEMRSLINIQLEHKRKEKFIGQSLEAIIIINITKNHKYYKIISEFKLELSDWFMVSHCKVLVSKNSKQLNSKFLIYIEKSYGEKCIISWKFENRLNKINKCNYISMISKEALLMKY